MTMGPVIKTTVIAASPQGLLGEIKEI